MTDLIRSEKQLTADEAQLKSVRSAYDEKYGFRDPEKYAFKSQKGLNADIVRQISEMKNEPAWMTEFRLKAYEIFMSKPIPQWGSKLLNDINFDDI